MTDSSMESTMRKNKLEQRFPKSAGSFKSKHFYVRSQIKMKLFLVLLTDFSDFSKSIFIFFLFLKCEIVSD